MDNGANVTELEEANKRLSENEKEKGKCSYECAFEHQNISGNSCMVANCTIKVHKYRICFSPFFSIS